MQEFIADKIPMFLYILKGIHISISYGFLSMFFGLCIAIILTFIKIKDIRFLNYLINSYISIFRGTPMLLQLSIFYFGISNISKINMNASFAAILTLSLNSGAYLYEVVRGGINAVPKGQFEAAKVLGIKDSIIMKDIILPQAIKNIFPALTNELITLLKDTSLVSVLGIQEMMFRAKIIAIEYYIWFTPLIIAGAIYYLLVTLISFISRKIETILAQ